MNIFESDSAHSNCIEGKSNISLPDEQLEIFDTESAASNLDQLCVFSPEEQDLADTSNNDILHESDVICLTSAKKSNTSILEQHMSCTERKNTSINVIANNKNSSFDSTVPSLHDQRKKRKLKKIVNKIMNRQMITNLVKELDKNNLLRDFLFPFRLCQMVTFPSQIYHISLLETMRFHRLPDSRHMWYSKKMKKFWHCFYKVGGGPPLRLLSGPKGIGINNCETSSCSINFAVPSTNTIRTYDQSDSAKVIPPSIFHPIIDKISKSVSNTPKEFILSYDGKSVGTGLKGDNCGDVDLWGFEFEPNLKNAEDCLKKENIIIEHFNEQFRAENYSACQETVVKIVAIMTSRIKDIRKIIDKCKKTEIKYTKADMENLKYKDKHQYTIQGAQYLADNCKAIIRRALNVNRELCEILAYINKTHELFHSTGIIHFHEQPNLKILMEPHDIRDFFEENDDTVYVKQRTDIWERIHKMCSVTGSTICTMH